MRTGAEYLSSLNDGRQVYLDGQAVDDVAKHPAFAGVARTVATMLDVAASPERGMQTTRADGTTVNKVFTAPYSREDLVERRRAIETWAEVSHGWIGRSPDHVGTYMAAFGAHPEVFTTETRDFSQNVRDYVQRVQDENLYLAYAIIPPQYSRATTASGWGEEFIQVGVVEEREDGIVVRGSQMLATGAAVADEIFVSCIKPLGPDDVDFAVSFAVPAAAEGLKLYHRRPYAPQASSEFDYPLTTRFDEPDALVVFDDVLIPWERVFACRDTDTVRRQFFGTGAHALGNWQAQIRFTAKLKFIASVARRVTQVNGTDRIPGVREKLGEIASLVSLIESAVLAAEYTAEPDESGLMIPGARALYGSMGLQSEMYPRVIAILRDLVGGGVLQLPATVRDLESDLTRGDLARYVKSPGVETTERVKLFKLAWDIIGTEFGGRHQQYEMFYAGAPFLVKGVYAFDNFGYESLLPELDAFLASVPGPDVTTAPAPTDTQEVSA
ncbi:4-hydroxyphenylacetate 3-hydroxylase family protein [Streptomyces sp. NRRL S-340]|uniref:4-hydroxyphenylacetate 3-hydroxylase family protein n=1 Tax=Streptomyces sp. NRRL S-340 TaxID=1463901 RepID=UPI0006896F96|nr:4-hydroxyphenylacetate 3-hydroxylase N-terminal domain-containing protein [Streptomyces sp. NRRL S-340]